MKHTYPDWESSRKQFTDFCTPGHEVDITIWEYFQDVVPPILMPHGFLVGEPFDVNDKGQTTYMAFVKDQNRDIFYYFGTITIEEYIRKYKLPENLNYGAEKSTVGGKNHLT